ncbi:MAG: PQQ-dependent sugar dehydrogenase [Rubripirellula sp.]|nr:PQQ-dependent sugar dehydrogenase [Rubripirellula sp.]
MQSSFGVDPQDAESGRVPWNDSTVVGFPDSPPPFEVVQLYSHLDIPKPMGVTALPGTSDLLVHVHQGGYGGPGRLLRVSPGAANSKETKGELEEFLVLDEIIYGVAFHPNFKENGLMYVGCNGKSEALDKVCTRVLRFHIQREAPFRCDAASQMTIIEWPSNGHNGGDLVFGHDGMLYVSAGDGTSDSDANHAGQDLTTLPGSMLRIDVDHPTKDLAYSIPTDNPFLHIDGARPEIWAYGLRNPWRISVDAGTGDLWAGINGQDLWETAQVVRRGENYGWSITEGSHPFQTHRKRGPTPIVPPTLEHPHSEARSLTGGHVYYGNKHPILRGHYVYGDYATGMIWAAKYEAGSVLSHFPVARTSLQIAGFGIDHEGELIVVDHGGGLYALVPTRQQQSSSFPRLLSQTGIYESITKNRMHAGLIPYRVNSPLWSDGAVKDRFIGIPGKRTIEFQTAKSWDFPDGTVLVKTFSLPLADKSKKASDQTHEPPLTRIETRLMTRQNGEWHGYSYQWNAGQTDAVLVEASGHDQIFEVASKGGKNGFAKQTWHYPSRSECMVCHSRASNFVLGLSVRQTNLTFSDEGHTFSQLEQFKQLGLFHASHAKNKKEPTRDTPFKFPSAVEDLPKLADPADTNQDLESRVRSYLHSNCANCHVKEGGGNSNITLAVNRALEKTGIIDVAASHDSFGITDAKLIKPADPSSSILLQRMKRRGRGQMPPLATSMIDEDAVSMITQWINQLPVGEPTRVPNASPKP